MEHQGQWVTWEGGISRGFGARAMILLFIPKKGFMQRETDEIFVFTLLRLYERIGWREAKDK